jgi:ectoine hydroxylase
MISTSEHIEHFRHKGFISLAGSFCAEEVAVLRQAAPVGFGPRVRSEIWRQKSGVPRTAFACHPDNAMDDGVPVTG